jgi:predicted ATPase
MLIEQPEIHLHPKAQSQIADLFVDRARSRDCTFIIETHSEHILDRIRRRIAEKRIDKDMVAIYYFQPGPEGTQIQEIVLDDDGQLIKFPLGFFEEGYAEALEHMKAIKSNM